MFQNGPQMGGGLHPPLDPVLPFSDSPPHTTLKGTPFKEPSAFSVNYEAFRNEEAPLPQTPPEAGF